MSRSRGCGKLSHNQNKTPFCLQISNARPGKCLGGGGAASVTGQTAEGVITLQWPHLRVDNSSWAMPPAITREFCLNTNANIKTAGSKYCFFLFPSLLPDYLTGKSSSNLLKSFIPGKEHSHSGRREAESRNLVSFR